MREITATKVAGMAKTSDLYETFTQLLGNVNAWLKANLTIPAGRVPYGGAGDAPLDSSDGFAFDPTTGKLSSPGPVESKGTGFIFPDGSVQPTACFDPAGVVKMFAGSALPAGYLWCDGAAVSRATYAVLFAKIGTTFGAGDGSTTFNVPDLRGRFPLGKATAGTGSTLGATGGAIDHTHNHAHTHTIAHTHTLVHTHQIDPPATDTGGSFATAVAQPAGAGFDATIGGHTHNVDIPAFTSGAASTSTTSSPSSANTGAASVTATDANNPPFLSLNFIIKT